MSATDSLVPGLPEDAFIHDGLVTKRAARALALAHLRPRGNELLWDLGAGAGSVMIEWLRSCPGTRAIGVERRADRLANAATNLASFGLDHRAELRHGPADEVLTGLPDPDAVFIGGGLSSGVLATCLVRLRAGGRFVAHGVTIEAETGLAAAHASHGGELTRIAVETSDLIGRFRSWKPLRTITQWVWEKPAG